MNAIKRIYWAFGLLCLLLITLNGVLIYQSARSAAIAARLETASNMRDLSDAMKLEVVQVQQWLTDISATRAAPGLDDGYKEAEKYAKLFRENNDKLKKLFAGTPTEETLKDLDKTFEVYYDMGRAMAAAYIKDGPAGGNAAMEKFDPAAEKMTTSLSEIEALIEKTVREAHDESDRSAARAKTLSLLITTAAIIGFVLAVMLAYYLSRNVTKPITQMVEAIKEVAQGDFTREVPVTSRDEIGIMGETFNGMVEELRGMFKEIGGNSRTVAASAEQLSAVSTQLASSSDQMAQQAAGVASATEQMSSNINSMAAAVEEASVNATTVSSTAEEMSANMHSIASAVEEMSHSIREVAKSTGETSHVAGEAMGLSKSASDTMHQLGAAANEIGKVTAMIKRIAEQTNLLALNATIEAASAGEAGRGFAVVANEIKELANQSARAAEEIAVKIDGVRGSATSAVKVISDVSEIIGKINTSVEAITGAMDQQTAAANEISRNVAEVSKGAVEIAGSIAEVAKGTTDISRNSGEAARGANNVSSNILGISKAVRENNAGIQQIHTSSSELTKIAGALYGLVAKFKVEDNGGTPRLNQGDGSRRELR